MSKTTLHHNAATSNRAEIVRLKSRVQELESEVLSLKKRLEELRKAKNTTVLKKEKEYISTANPKQRSNGSSNSRLEQRLEQLRIEHEKEIRELQDKKPAEVKCNHLPEISKLQKEKKILETENEDMKRINRDLKEENNSLLKKFEELFTELSIKEAQWCEKEEELNLKLKLQWSEKYKDWMAATELKISELQAANNLLRQYVKPHGKD
ncbi:probable DNA double-strand break repair Rad50 ATPase [Anneissia japonica]|uniref:probable DNA double-strand break repair Rad50 ATPase n=1 Tax=Anneissia japonica TaxID=1529436 RepID=UPI001425ACB9|nr:probable DNA double-strand break repair Rad50 ATPase [Anneissia japonica]